MKQQVVFNFKRVWNEAPSCLQLQSKLFSSSNESRMKLQVDSNFKQPKMKLHVVFNFKRVWNEAKETQLQSSQ